MSETFAEGGKATLVNGGGTEGKVLLSQSAPFACNFCPKQFDQPGTRDHHVEDKHKGRNYLCHDCGFIKRGNSNLNSHISKCGSQRFTILYENPQHQISLYDTSFKNCQLCPAQFTNLVAKRHHFDEIHRQRKFICQLCEARMISYQDVLKHNEDHQGNACFRVEYGIPQLQDNSTCSICHKVFKDEKNMERHMKIQHEGRFHDDAENIENAKTTENEDWDQRAYSDDDDYAEDEDTDEDDDDDDDDYVPYPRKRKSAGVKRTRRRKRRNISTTASAKNTAYGLRRRVFQEAEGETPGSPSGEEEECQVTENVAQSAASIVPKSPVLEAASPAGLTAGEANDNGNAKNNGSFNCSANSSGILMIAPDRKPCLTPGKSSGERPEMAPNVAPDVKPVISNRPNKSDVEAKLNQGQEKGPPSIEEEKRSIESRMILLQLLQQQLIANYENVGLRDGHHGGDPSERLDVKGQGNNNNNNNKNSNNNSNNNSNSNSNNSSS